LELEGIELLKRKIRNGGCLVDLEVAYLESDELHLLELKMRHALPLLRPLTDALLIYNDDRDDLESGKQHCR